jgi:hypothetical protein
MKNPLPDHYELEKKIWTEAGYQKMGWHDSPIYALAFQSDPSTLSSELILDIDYIFQWIHPVPPNLYFSFWIAPATLVFKEVHNLDMQINQDPPNIFDLEIADIHRLEQLAYPNGSSFWKWHIELQNGHIYFDSNGYEQFIKQQPVLASQQFPPQLRGISNFNKFTF